MIFSFVSSCESTVNMEELLENLGVYSRYLKISENLYGHRNKIIK